MLKEILIVAPFVSLPGEPGLNRFLYLAFMWSKDYKVTFVTSSFCHGLKCHRDRQSDLVRNLPFDLVLLDEPGYKKNVSIARVKSHVVFVKELKKWLVDQVGRKRFDVAYSAYPLMTTNLVLADVKKQFGFKLVIDVQDVWPEAIASAYPAIVRLNKNLWPLSKCADKIYSKADGLIAVSETYLTRARNSCPDKLGLVAYIGADLRIVDAIPPESLPSGIFRMIYLGTISYSYDLETVVRGFNRLQESHKNIELHIMGGGPHLQNIRNLAGERVFFHGIVSYEKMVAYAKSCDLAINSIAQSAPQSVTNKISDYFAIGLPILSSQTCPEVVDLVRQAGGYNYEAGNVNSFCETFKNFMRNADKNEVKARTKKIGMQLFNRTKVYPKITDFLQVIYEGA